MLYAVYLNIVHRSSRPAAPDRGGVPAAKRKLDFKTYPGIRQQEKKFFRDKMMKNENDNPKKDIGKRIHDIRAALGLKQEQVALRLGCSRSNLSQVENGLILPGFTILSALRKELNVSVDWLLTGEGSMFIHEKEKGLYLLDFGKDTGEVKEMLEEMKESQALKYRMLSDFFTLIGEARFKRRKKEKNKEN